MADSDISSYFGPAMQFSGGLLSNIFQGIFNSQNRNFARQQAEIERKRADTAIQRQVEDLKAAGINPLMATPSGAMSGIIPTASSGQALPITMDFGSVAQNRHADIAEKKLPWELAEIESRIDKLSKDGQKVNQEIINLQAQKLNVEANTRQLEAMIGLIGEEVLSEKTKQELNRSMADLNRGQITHLSKLCNQLDFEISKGRELLPYQVQQLKALRKELTSNTVKNYWQIPKDICNIIIDGIDALIPF